MCGILGIVSLCHQPVDLEMARRSLDNIRHRGPNDEGYLLLDSATQQVVVCGGADTDSRLSLPVLEDFTNRPFTAVFGHRRLSILDLSIAGHQPMQSCDGRYWIVYNGEIYNYLELKAELKNAGVCFKTQTDTEVALAALIHWGTENALKRFQGMFAIALIDVKFRTVLLARDAFGIKPLFVCKWQQGFAFASEISSLMELPGVDISLEPDRTWMYLRFGVTDYGDKSMLSGIRQVPPAHWVQLQLDADLFSWDFQHYWDPYAITRCELSFEDAVEQTRHLFLRNISWHLRSDVPVGTALSGGIDSSAIVCAIRHLYPDHEIHTFSYLADDKFLNEEKWVELVNQKVSAIPHSIKSSGENLESDINFLLKCQGEPFGSTSIYAQYCVFRAASEAGITVMLDGQGADEILAGYVPYQGARLASLFAQGRIVEATKFLLAQRGMAGRTMSDVLINALGHLLPDIARPIARSLVGKTDRPIWANLGWFINQETRLDCPWYHGVNKEYLRSDLKESVSTTLMSLLRYEDRNSMAFSIESRVPFLTTDFVDLSLSLPESFLIGNDGVSKRVFRAAMKGIIPNAILERNDKIGFATPELAWLRNNKDFVSRSISRAHDVPCLSGTGVEIYCQQMLSGDRPFSFQIWRLLNFLHWQSDDSKLS